MWNYTKRSSREPARGNIPLYPRSPNTPQTRQENCHAPSAVVFHKGPSVRYSIWPETPTPQKNLSGLLGRPGRELGICLLKSEKALPGYLIVYPIPKLNVFCVPLEHERSGLKAITPYSSAKKTDEPTWHLFRLPPVEISHKAH